MSTKSKDIGGRMWGNVGKAIKIKRVDAPFNFSGILHTWDKVAVFLVTNLAMLRCPLASIVSGTLAKSRRTL